MEIGELVKVRRKSLDMPIEELADKTGKNRATLYRYESGRIKDIPFNVLSSMSESLQTTVDYLTGCSDDQELENLKTGHRRIAGEYLRVCRNERGISQQELADHVGVAKQTIYKYEKGICNIPLGNLILICDYLNVKIEFTFRESEVEEE